MFTMIMTLVALLSSLLGRKSAPPCYIPKGVRSWEQLNLEDGEAMYFPKVEWKMIWEAYRKRPFEGMGRTLPHAYEGMKGGGYVLLRGLKDCVASLERLPVSDLRDYLIGKCGGDIFQWEEIGVLEGFVSLSWENGKCVLRALKEGGRCTVEQEEHILSTSNWEEGEYDEDGWNTPLRFPVYWEEGNKRVKLGKLFAQLAKKQDVEEEVVKHVLDKIAEGTVSSRRIIVSRCMGDVWNMSTGHGFTSCLSAHGCHAKGAAWAAMNGDMVAYTVAMNAKPGVAGPWLSRIHLRHDQHGRFVPEAKTYGSMGCDPELQIGVEKWLKSHGLLGNNIGLHHTLHAARAGYTDTWGTGLGSYGWSAGWSSQVKYDKDVLQDEEVAPPTSTKDLEEMEYLF